MPRLGPGRLLLALVLLACHIPPSRAGERIKPPASSGAADTASLGPSFASSIRALPPERRKAMVTAGVWRPGCPVPLASLALVEVVHWNFEGRSVKGELVVSADVAQSLVEVFRELHRLRFPIQRMQPVEAFGGSDDASMAANNTSAFNCRVKTGGRAFSLHAYGRAIDVNPVQNPYVRGSRVLPPEGRAHLERTADVPGRIVRGPVTRAFAAHGWKWGGAWSRSKDYQHFETKE